PRSSLPTLLPYTTLFRSLTVLPLNSVENQVRPLFVEPFDLVLPPEHDLVENATIQLDDLLNTQVLVIDDEHLQRQISNVCEKSGDRKSTRLNSSHVKISY